MTSYPWVSYTKTTLQPWHSSHQSVSWSVHPPQKKLDVKYSINFLSCGQGATARSYKSRSRPFNKRNWLLTTLLYVNMLMFLLLMFMYMQYFGNLIGNLIGIRVCTVQGIPLQRPVEAWCSAVKCCLTCEINFRMNQKSGLNCKGSGTRNNQIPKIDILWLFTLNYSN